MGERFINTKNLYSLLDIEPFIILASLVLLAWVFYKLFLGEASEERHKNLKRHFKNLLRHTVVFATLFLTYLILKQSENHPELSVGRALPYVGLCSLFMGMVVFVKTSRLIILQYLFLGSMKHGVPVLVVNIVSLILSVILGIWCAAFIFDLQVTPLLATSAVFSIVLGLALQDTLGNLFAGISLQIDKSFEIGDWLEVTSGSQKVTGQVQEITWRATMLAGWSDELITLPNRFLASSQIANFSGDKPIYRGQIFRLSYGVDVHTAKKALLEGIKQVGGIRSWPEPVVLIHETTDSWIAFKLSYCIDNYGAQYGIADQVVENGLRFLHAQNIQAAPQRLHLLEG